jgi:hypothetical protein
MEYLISLFNRLKDAQMAARKNLTLAKIKAKHYYDKKINSYNFSKGNYMYLLKELQEGKLDNQYLRSYLISDKIRNYNVKLAIGKKRIKIVHEDKLKKANILPEDEFAS